MQYFLPNKSIDTFESDLLCMNDFYFLETIIVVTSTHAKKLA
jgi:hypothetical protein